MAIITHEMIGTVNSDRTRTWPEFNLHGQRYERGNVTIANIDKTHFIVLPVNVQFTDEMRAESMALISPPVSGGFSRVKKEQEKADGSS